jgi:surface protein
METEGKRILVNYLTDIADTFRSITGETDTISAESFSKEVQAVATPSSKNSYQRNSIEEMNAITDAKDGDTCLCYYTNSFNIIKDCAVRVITFPKKVVFKKAITEYYKAEIRAADDSVDLWGMIRLSPDNFEFQVDKMDDQSRANAFYSSEDGITYTLNQSPDVEGSFELVNERTVDFKINIVIQNTNEHIGAFLIGTDQVFDGLYKYDGNWKILSLNYSLDNYNVEVSKKYYNNGEQEGLLGTTGTLQGVQKLNNFIKKYGTDFVYPKDMSRCFSNYEGERIPLLELNPNTSNVTNMSSMLSGNINLTEIPLFDTSNVTNMSYMFSGNINLTKIPLLDTSNVTNISFLFQNCSNLKNIPLLDTSNVIDMKGMFQDCSSLKTIPMLNTSNVTEMDYLFERDSLLTEIPLLNTVNVTRMPYLFSNCHGLISVPALDTSNVTVMNSMFKGCSSLKQIPLLNTNSCNLMQEMFSGCSSITEIPELDTSNVISMWYMFFKCTSLTTVPMLDASKIINVYNMFNNCSSLVTLGGLKNLGMSYPTNWIENVSEATLNLSDSPLLTHDSLMNVINNLYDIKSKGVKPQTLQLGNTNKAKLTTEEIAIATNKGWNVK